MKRIFDIVFSLLGLVMLSPFMVVIAILVKLDSPGPVFYRQERIGKDFRPFRIFKFRTMIADADKKGLQITAGGDERITRVGRWLRKTKLDELPQLINVLKGDMSFVGPRPEVEKYVRYYKDEYELILQVRPGITDIASIIFRDEESILKDKGDPEDYYKNTLLPEKLKLAKKYVKKQSVMFDIRLIYLTLIKIILPHYSALNEIGSENS
jgi:lipopolysaccharide/colanic/teichoic acid biosynthesis glycosyltransferase